MGIASAIIGFVFSVASYVVSRREMKKMKKTAKRTYSDTMATETSNTMPIPIIYGTVKNAGNLIYSKLWDNNQRVAKLIVFCDGKIKGIRDIKLDDTDINSSDFEGVSYNTYVGDGEQLIDGRVDGTTNSQRAQKVGGLKYDAYVALEAKANDNLSGSFNVTAMIDGKIVKCYTSETEYTEEWSNNPAWCVLDFLTCYNGVGLDIDEIDIPSFLEAAKFYDDKDYTLNICLDETQSRLDWVSNMLNCCRSSLVYKNGKYSLFVEKEDEVVQSFDPDSINNLELWWSPMEEIPDRIYVQFIDPDNEWVKVNAQAEAPNPLRKQPRIETYELYGVTNFDQASRLAWFYLNQAITCKMYVRFSTDRRALNRTVGDVISLTDYITEFQDKQFRIIKIADKQDGGIELTCREYNPSIYSEEKGATEPVINNSTLADPTEPPPAVVYLDNEQEYYILPNKVVVSRIFIKYTYPDYFYSRGVRVWYRLQGDETWSFGGIFDDGSNTAVIENMEILKTYEFKLVHENRYGKFSNPTYTPPILITGNNIAPEMPADFTGEEAVGGFSLSWTANKERDIDHYELYIGTVSESTKVADISGTSYFYSTGMGEYGFLLVAVDTVGNMSTPARLDLAIARPANVTGFDCVQNERNIEFRWNKVQGATYYVIREGSSWDYGNFIGSSAGQTFTLPFAQATQVDFWMKAYTEFGVPCEFASYCTVRIASIPNRNMIYTYDAVEDEWSGLMHRGYVNARGFQLEDNSISAEYIYEIELDQEYCCRNWVEKIVQPFSPSKEKIWKELKFTWDSETAKNTTWMPVGTDYTFNTFTDIAIYLGNEATSSLDYWTLDETLISNTGKTPDVPYGIVSYGQGRFHKGLKIDGHSLLKWQNLEIPKVFSLSVNVMLPIDSDYSYAILTLKNSKTGDWMLLSYNSEGDRFVLTTDTGVEVSAGDFSHPNDHMTFVVSQGDGYLNLIVYSSVFSLFKNNKIAYKDYKTYDSIALYSDI